MSWYEERVLPLMIRKVCSAKPNMKQREKIVPLASGVVLEVGFGTGLNLPYYDRNIVRKVFALEPSEGMRKLAASPIHESQLDVELIDLPGEQIPLAAGSVDTVLITYTLCTIPDALSALDGMRRVLRPGGKLLFCEHGRAPDESVRAWQNRLNPAWRKIAGGCNMNRDIPSLLKAGGFRVENDYRMYIPGFRALCYNYWGSAVAA